MSFENVFELEVWKSTIAMLYVGMGCKFGNVIRKHTVDLKGRKHEVTSRASKTIFEFSLSKTLENEILGSRTNMLIISL